MKIYPIMLAILVALSSFSGDDKDKVFDNGDKWIPADFDARRSTLLVENFSVGGNERAAKASEKVTDGMKDYMKESYPYKYEFASADDIRENKKYADKETYRYVLSCSNRSHLSADMTMRYPINDFHIYDRKAGKGYPATGKGTSYVINVFRPVVNTLVKFMKALK